MAPVIEPRKETIVMTLVVVTAIFGIAVVLVLVVGIALSAPTVETPGLSTWTLGNMFVGARPSDRPRGVQEEDLPRFVFKDTAPAAAPC
jgi:hypothetical protein